MQRGLRFGIGLVGIAALAAACSAGGGNNVFTSSTGDNKGGESQGGNGGTAATTGEGAGGSGFTITTNTGGGSTGNVCDNGPNVDGDGDGWTAAEGDCNDCDPNVNPGAIEVIATAGPDGGVPEPADEDCDGTIDNVPEPCDMGLGLGDLDPKSGAKAIDLCKFTVANPGNKNQKTWGVIDAQYVRANGTPTNPGAQVGIQTGFGPNVHPQGGSSLFSLSSGWARLPGQTGACNSNTCYTGGFGTPPPGFPQDVAGCDGETNINDDVALQVQIRTPTNATGYSFAFSFYSFEYPEWVCTSYNDQFISLVSPAPVGSVNGNISFDTQHNPVSVNVAFFNVCQGCPLGTGDLSGTGFDGSWGDDAGATGWLQSQAPVKGGDTITIRWAIWDTGDQAWDSTALVDNFQWIANGGTVVVGTDPIGQPK
jgi:hypothetical protein